jgi:two-component system, OmpR family, KDP operon response regulator KdpE
MMRLLIADDDAHVASLVAQSVALLWADCSTSNAPDGREALRCFAEKPPDLVILDVSMPPPDGLEVCRRIRQAAPTVPILMLTGRDTLLDEVRALDLGADAYLTKPFDVTQLLGRLRALARRANRSLVQAENEVESDEPGNLVVDFASRQVRVGSLPVDLSPTEYLLLEYLARHPGQILPHRALLEHVWGGEYAHNTNYLKVFINRLRRKLGDRPGRPGHIQTCRGFGYRLATARTWDGKAGDGGDSQPAVEI